MTHAPPVTREHLSAPALRSVRDVASLADVTWGVRSTPWWGTLGFMVIEGTTLIVAAVAYLYLRQNFFHWPPVGIRYPSLGVPVAQLVVMAASIVPMALAARSALRLDLPATRRALLAAAVIKVAVLVLRWYEFEALNVKWSTNAYGSAAWIVLGFHATLLVLDFAEDVGLLILLHSRRAQAKHLSDVVDDTMYWYFTVLSWIPLFLLVFVGPRWM